VLIEDAPGLGKTTLAASLAKATGCSFGRIQFTPDLLPSDITGFTMFDMKSGEQKLHKGGVMRQFVLADEINRTSPKTQSALLEAMQERQVTVDGHTIPLPRPFMVLATQNPLEFSGTYPLPEAEMDRFFLRIRMGYPNGREELEILSRHQAASSEHAAKPAAKEEDVLAMQHALNDVFIADALKEYIVAVAQATREHADVELPVSPRGSIALMRAAMGAAMLVGREYVLPDDVQDMAVPVLAHRLGLRPAARAKGGSGETVLGEIVKAIPVPAAQ